MGKMWFSRAERSITKFYWPRDSSLYFWWWL